MNKKLLAFIFIFSSTVMAADITCPTVDNIKSNQLSGWLPLYIEYEELASTKDTEQFRREVTRFEVARWNRVYLENAHCFYEGEGAMPKKIILAHDAYRPQESEYWNWVTPYALAECRAEDTTQCRFNL